MMSESLQWRTEKRRVRDLKQFQNNPRKLTNKQREELLTSIEKFDLVEIPVIDVDGTVIAGNQRIEILRMLGRNDEEIEVRVPNRPLTKEEREEYLLRSNKNTGEWDFDALVVHFDREMLFEVGFTAQELGLEKDPEEKPEDEFGIPEMELKSFEHWDYLVFVFRNTYDWLNILEKFGVGKVNAGFSPKQKKIGLGRVIDGARLLEALGVQSRDSEPGAERHDHEP